MKNMSGVIPREFTNIIVSFLNCYAFLSILFLSIFYNNIFRLYAILVCTWFAKKKKFVNMRVLNKRKIIPCSICFRRIERKVLKTMSNNN